MPLPPDWSALEVAAVRGQSRLISCRSLQPLKLLQPASHTASCHAVVSSYGGGLLAGDVSRLSVHCHPDSRLLLSTQANTRIYRSDFGAVAEQHTHGHLEANALAVVFPDPVVLQGGSRYRQQQHWQLDATALLLLADWFQAGRTDSGERFAFHSLHSELRVSRAGRTVLLDRFAFQPAEHIATAPANFMHYQIMLSVYLVGDPAASRFQHLAKVLLGLKLPGSTDPSFDMTTKTYALTVSEARPGVYILRAGAGSRRALQPVCEAILAAVACEDFLGYNALTRKY